MNETPIPKVPPVIHTFLKEIIEIHRDENLLLSCYADVKANYFDNNLLASYAFNIPAISFTEKNELLREVIIEHSDIFSYIKNSSPIFLFGHIGQGKTTFLHYLTDIRIPSKPEFELLRNRVYFYYVSYRRDDEKFSFIRTDVENRLEILVNDILRQHNFSDTNGELDYDTLKAIFPAEEIRYSRRKKERRIEGLKEYILNKYDDLGYLRGIIKWLSETKKIKICCVVDNIDQHFNFKDCINKFIELFQFIQSLYLQLILPLRFSNIGFQNNSYFNAFSPMTVSLGMPDYAEMISKRIDLIEKHFTQKLLKPVIAFENNSHILSDEIFKKLKSICGYIKGHKQVKRSLELLSNYSPRTYLEIMLDVLNSNYLFTHPLTNINIDYSEHISKGKFNSLFIYSLMLRDYKHRDEDPSIPIINLFNNNSNNNWNSFIRFHLLLFLSNISTSIHISNFIDAFQISYPNLSREAIKSVLKVFVRKNCIGYQTDEMIEVTETDKIIQNEDCIIEISPRGLFHLDLIKELEYYEIIAIPYLRKGDLRQINETSKKERADNLKSFLRFLLKQEEHISVVIENEIEEQYKDKMFWTNLIYPKLIQEYDIAFPEYPITT
jgi:hypothetical protein